MSSLNELQYCGTFLKPNGFKGHVMLRTEEGLQLNLNSSDAVFIEINSVPTPFFIEEIQHTNKGYKIKLEGLNSDASVLPFAGKKFWLKPENVKKERNASNELEGFELHDKIKGFIGMVLRLEGNPLNPLLCVKQNEAEILLPYQQNFIEKIDRKTKKIHYSAPEGLLDIYLEGENEKND